MLTHELSHRIFSPILLRRGNERAARWVDSSWARLTHHSSPCHGTLCSSDPLVLQDQEGSEGSPCLMRAWKQEVDSSLEKAAGQVLERPSPLWSSLAPAPHFFLSKLSSWSLKHPCVVVHVLLSSHQPVLWEAKLGERASGLACALPLCPAFVF